jgi:hypothetical protein
MEDGGCWTDKDSPSYACVIKNDKGKGSPSSVDDGGLDPSYW